MDNYMRSSCKKKGSKPGNGISSNYHPGNACLSFAGSYKVCKPTNLKSGPSNEGHTSNALS